MFCKFKYFFPLINLLQPPIINFFIRFLINIVRREPHAAVEAMLNVDEAKKIKKRVKKTQH